MCTVFLSLGYQQLSILLWFAVMGKLFSNYFWVPFTKNNCRSTTRPYKMDEGWINMASINTETFYDHSNFIGYGVQLHLKQHSEKDTCHCSVLCLSSKADWLSKLQVQVNVQGLSCGSEVSRRRWGHFHVVGGNIMKINVPNNSRQEEKNICLLSREVLWSRSWKTVSDGLHRTIQQPSLKKYYYQGMDTI